MSARENRWLSASFRWVLGGHATRKARQELRARLRRLARRDALACETLEGRVVLSDWGGGAFGGGASGANALLEGLNDAGVITRPITASPTSTPTSSNNTSTIAQLEKDEQALQTELASLSAKSGVTVADLTKLETDAQVLETAFDGIDPSKLNQALSDLAAANAANPTTTVTTASAQSEFTGLFPSDATTQAAATTVYTDLVQIVKDSGVSGSDLGTVATDEAAIQTDLSNLNPFGHGDRGGGGGGGGGGDGRSGNSGGSGNPGGGLLGLVGGLVSDVENLIGGSGGLGGLAGDIGSILSGPGFGSESEAPDALTTDLNNLGVITSPVVASTSTTTAPTSSNPLVAQLQKDQQALQTELQNLSGTSNVTVADLTALANDSQALGDAFRGITPSDLQQALSAIANANAVGATGTPSVSAAQSQFLGLFSMASQTAATSVYNDLVKIVTDSGVKATDLSTVAKDQAAIQADLTAIQNAGPTGDGDGDRGDHGGGEHGSATATVFTSILNNLGVITTPVTAPPTTVPTSSNPLVAQLQKDQQALQTELASLSAKSGVTVADLTKLATDSQPLAAAVSAISTSDLKKALSDLAAANAVNPTTTVTAASAQSEFTGLFPSDTTTQAAATNVYTDLVQIVKDSGVTGTDLSTVATDQAAIQTDLSNLHNGTATPSPSPSPTPSPSPSPTPSPSPSPTPSPSPSATPAIASTGTRGGSHHKVVPRRHHGRH